MQTDSLALCLSDRDSNRDRPNRARTANRTGMFDGGARTAQLIEQLLQEPPKMATK